jgi:SHS2 domain-containing protein
MGHHFIDHTADVAADLDGNTPGELFASAAMALTDTITALETVQPSVTESVTLEAPALDDLLVDWLNELIYRFEVRNVLFSRAEVVVEARNGRWWLTGTAAGEPFDPARHPARVLVKSATYHGLHVVNDDGTWRARIVFDI